VNWDPQTEKLLVRVTEGKVEVTGDGRPKHELTAGLGARAVGAVGVQSALVREQPAATASAGSPDSAERERARRRRADSARKPPSGSRFSRAVDGRSLP
jgi:hypothetical protein